MLSDQMKSFKKLCENVRSKIEIVNEHEESIQIIKDALPQLEKLVSSMVNERVVFDDPYLDSLGHYVIEASNDAKNLGVFAPFFFNARLRMNLWEDRELAEYSLQLAIRYENSLAHGGIAGEERGKVIWLKHKLTFDGDLIVR